MGYQSHENMLPAVATHGVLRLAVVAFACSLSTAGLGGELPANRQAPAIPEAVEAYSRELNIISSDANPKMGLEGLLRLGRKAAAALLQPPTHGGADVLERLSDEDFHKVVLKMKGFAVNRAESLYVEPDPRSFLALAKRSGDQASVDLFEAYTKTGPEAHPIYIEQQTDYSGCIRFGTMSLVDSYKQWDAYGNKYANRYANEVKDFIRDIEEELTNGTCACEGKEAVLREFAAFIRAFPRSRITTRVRERIRQIQEGKSDMRWHCISG
jgi:hypothetical protein